MLAGKSRETRVAELLAASKRAALVELAAAVAHEINNPMASISAYAEQLLDAARNPALTSLPEFAKFPGHLDTIRRNVKRSTEITRILLEFSGRRGPESLLRAIPDAVKDALPLIEQKAARAGVRVEQDVPGGLPAVRCQANDLELILVELAANAIEASPPGGAILLEACADGPDAVVTVRDGGRGVPLDLRERIFSPLFTTDTQRQGIGLGLSICARIVKRLRGRIALTAHEGPGTAVAVRLPGSEKEAV